MNISKAIFLNKLSPENISKDLYSVLIGFEEVATNDRKANYFDLFIVFAFYNYRSATAEFKNIRYNKYTSFKTNIERNPDIFSNINLRYSHGIEYCKKAILYGISKGLFTLDEDFHISTLPSKNISINNALKNIGKVFSSKTTNELYNYFEVDVNEI